MYLMEDVLTREGTVEEQFVPHNFSVDQVFELVVELLKAVNIVLTPDEMKDRMGSLESALAVLKSYRGTEPEGRGRLKIHEAM